MVSTTSSEFQGPGGLPEQTDPSPSPTSVGRAGLGSEPHGSIHVPAGVVATMRTHATETYPEECCGGLLGTSGTAADGDGAVRVVRCIAVRNARSDERERRYLIGPELVNTFEREADASGLELIGFYHSHPDHPARPSAFDRDHAWPWYTYIIVPVESGVANAPRAWRLGDDRESFDELQIVEGREREVT